MLLTEMSATRTYNLRTRAGAGIASQNSGVGGGPLSESPDTSLTLSEENPDGPTSAFETAPPVAVRTYSDVVAARPPSPLRERPTSPFEDAAPAPEGASLRNRPVEEENGEISNNNNNIVTNDENDTPEGEDESQWTTVKRRCTRRGGQASVKNKAGLTSEQRKVVNQATEGMTDAEKEKIQRRQENMRHRRGSSVSSRGEGPARPKGKTIDP